MLPFSKTVIDVELPSRHVLLSKITVLNNKSLQLYCRKAMYSRSPAVARNNQVHKQGR